MGIQSDVSLEHYRRLFEVRPEPQLVTTTEGRIVESNPAAAELFGVDRRTLSGQSLTDRVAGADDRSSLRHVMKRAAASEDPIMLAVSLGLPRGATVVEARVVAYAVRRETQLSWLLRDLSETPPAEHERSREAIELERGQLEALVQDLPAAVLMVDAATEDILVANEAGRSLLRAGTGEARSRIHEITLLGADGAEVPMEERPAIRALRGATTAGQRFSYRGPDGRFMTVEMSASPLRDRSGRVVAAVIVAHDATEREQRERAEREFLSNAAHQLRTPVAAIQSAVDVLQGPGRDDLDARDRFLGHIASSAARLGRLSQSLLVLARAQSGERPRAELVEVAPLLRELTDLARPAANVRVGVRCPPDVVVLANRDLLREALNALFDNAIRYTRQGRIDLRARRNGVEGVVIEVADTGSGMTEETRARMFERFYGGDDVGSFGLGLAIAKQAAEAIGADIDVDSDVGRGTSVRLTFRAGMLRRS